VAAGTGMFIPSNLGKGAAISIHLMGNS
jgi:hypothetical protein